MARIIGRRKTVRRRSTVIGTAVAAALVLALFTAQSAFAAIDLAAFFELGPTPTAPEANITNILGNTTDPGPDWADLFDADGNKVISGGTPLCEQSPGKECAFIADASSAGGASDPTTFSGFGTSNKNNDPVSTADCANRTPPLTGSLCTPWGWASGNVPAKDDLTNVYAYQVVPTSGPRAGHSIVYGGIEREDPSGDSHVDLEFFLSPVGLCQTAGCESFTGVRTPGDVVVSMDFLQGGALGSVTVREWDGTQYVLQGSAGGQGCFTKSGAPGQDICAFNNGASINGGPWPNYNNHGKVITTLQANAFTEMGVDLTNVLGENPCISTFMGKTRSSGSFTSELKDFAGPTTFSICAPSTKLTKTPSATKVHSGGSVTYTYTEQNDGKDPLSSVSVTDNKCSPVSPTLGDGSTTADSSHNIGDLNNDNILDPGETWTFTCTTTVSADTTNTATASGFDALLNQTVTYCTDGPNEDGSGTSASDPTIFCDPDERAQATVTVITPATTLTKTAKVTVVYTFKEANTGDDPLSAVSVTDAYNSSHNTGLTACTPAAVLGADNVHNVGDTNNDGLLDPNETWTFQCTVTSTDGSDVDVWDTGTGHGTDSLGTAVPSTNESDGVKVAVTHCSGACS